MVDIKLGQGDSDDVPVILKESGIGADLTGTVVKLRLANRAGTLPVDITCLEGIRDSTNVIVTEFSAGGITVPITGIHTSVAGYSRGEFIATIGDRQATFLNGKEEDGENYFIMYVIEKLGD